MSKHTPGPWKMTNKTAADVIIRGHEGNIREQSLALVWLQDNDYNEANARLIVAAPEILDALKQITDELENQYGTYCNDEDSAFEKERLRLVSLCRSAIAKAEGNDNE